jgi:antigen flippase
MSSDLREQPAAASDSSYGQILRSSSIIGGAQAINYIVGLVRTKFVAVLLGPSGVGLVGLYVSIIGFIQTFAQFGINESGVREVAAAAGAEDKEKIAATVKMLRRLSWLTGMIGWALAVVLAWPLSQWTFGSTEHGWAIAFLGVTVLLELVSKGQKALLQGVRRVGDLARIQIAFALLSTVMAVALYWWLREDGIVPVIILTSVTQLFASWWFARRVVVCRVSQRWSETLTGAKGLIQLGSAFMYGALLAAAVGLAIRALIVRDLGVDAAGIYQAAWALSGLFGAFVLQAMGTDFYPRLTAAADSNATVTRLVNEQIEVGLLLALPGVLGAIALASVLVEVFYSAKFTFAAEPMRWFVLGVLGQTVSWPIGMVLAAKGSSSWLYVSRTFGAVLHLGLTVVLLGLSGLQGVAWAFTAYVWIQCLVVFGIGRHLSGFAFSHSALVLTGGSIALCAVTMTVAKLLPTPYGTIIALAASLLAAVFCVKGLVARVGTQGRLGRLLQRVSI